MEKKPFLKKNWPSILVLLYILSPIDFIPDDIPFIGNIDDTGVFLLDLLRQYMDYKKNAKETTGN